MVATARRAPSPDKPQGTLGVIWSWERPVHPFASSHYSREAAVEVRHQMDAEVAGVVANGCRTTVSILHAEFIQASENPVLI
jgi:hypothetical protein